MLSALRDIEQQHDVRILRACESGDQRFSRTRARPHGNDAAAPVGRQRTRGHPGYPVSADARARRRIDLTQRAGLPVCRETTSGCRSLSPPAWPGRRHTQTRTFRT
ncbi:hypothetical protein XbrCFBP1976_17815 [Xanthomonas bromi]|uniref:Uncharacterized protein n=1 Tax=Xanthomonas bromi TaxID=56449 RepID=A0ABX5BKY1_9XANT|nr:hypothetical protein XbrCFBP1976_17815 [Xanthomonas bromi]